MEEGGTDSNGREFRNAAEMWREQVGDDEADVHKRIDWYRHGVGYWNGVEASVNGVLGGYGRVSDADIKSSEAFLLSLLPDLFDDGGKNRHLVALDCGSGIGRVTKSLLIRYFNEVDLVEPVSHFLEAARNSLAPENLMLQEGHQATNFFCVPLQEFAPEIGRYDVIWIQWCIGHLTDNDFISFFKRAKIPNVEETIECLKGSHLNNNGKRYYATTQLITARASICGLFELPYIQDKFLNIDLLYPICHLFDVVDGKKYLYAV